MSVPRRLVLLGHPVGHSLSPRLQSAALVRAGIRLSYDAIDVEPARFAEIFRAMVSECAGGNVTIPFKTQAFAMCASRTDTATRTGAVNTFWVEDGTVCGDNTDVGGFDAAFRDFWGDAPRGLTVAVVGAGGAASAVLAAIERWEECRVAVFSRDPSRAQALCARFPTLAHAALTRDDAMRGADVIINATPIGLSGDDHPVPLSVMDASTAIFDLTYGAGETSWVRAARMQGRRASDGLAMLVEQGALAFQRWFGMLPDREAMWHAVR
jgi:shikimate dehydrogenase